MICLPTEHLGILKHSLKPVRAFLIELAFGSAGFQGGGKPEHPEKNHSEQRREPTTNSTQITFFHRKEQVISSFPHDYCCQVI